MSGYSGLILDFGCVVTTDPRAELSAFCVREGLAPDAFARVLRDAGEGRAAFEAVEAGEVPQRDFAVTIGRLFFPASDSTISLLLSVATFAVGFFTRPLGSVLLGIYGDRRGRKTALSLTIALMAVSTLTIALTPTYAHIGIAAPLIVLAARLVQGFSQGGEFGAATTALLLAVSAASGLATPRWPTGTPTWTARRGRRFPVPLSTRSRPRTGPESGTPGARSRRASVPARSWRRRGAPSPT